MSGSIALGLLDKEAGITSHDAVDLVRRALGLRRVGHAGTLDPFATGLLIVAWGRATRLLPFLGATAKLYRGRLVLGVTTDTDDATGTVLVRREGAIDEARLRATAASLTGIREQRAPAVSAIKQGGEPLYRRVRRGETVEPPLRRVRIDELRVLGVDGERGEVDFEVACSAGTYVRSLAREWGELLGTGAHLLRLRRTAIGPHRVEGALSTAALGSHPSRDPEALFGAAGLTPNQALAFLPAIPLDDDATRGVAFGRSPAINELESRSRGTLRGRVRLVDPSGGLVAVANLAGNASGASGTPERRPELELVWTPAVEARP